jgi:hypothetical protein
MMNVKAMDRRMEEYDRIVDAVGKPIRKFFACRARDERIIRPTWDRGYSRPISHADWRVSTHTKGYWPVVCVLRPLPKMYGIL